MLTWLPIPGLATTPENKLKPESELEACADHYENPEADSETYGVTDGSCCKEKKKSQISICIDAHSSAPVKGLGRSHERRSDGCILATRSQCRLTSSMSCKQKWRSLCVCKGCDAFDCQLHAFVRRHRAIALGRSYANRECLPARIVTLDRHANHGPTYSAKTGSYTETIRIDPSPAGRI